MDTWAPKPSAASGGTTIGPLNPSDTTIGPLNPTQKENVRWWNMTNPTFSIQAQGDLVIGPAGTTVGGGIYFDKTSGANPAGVFGTAGLAGGFNVGISYIDAGFSLRGIEGDAFNIDANIKSVSITVSFDSVGFNGLAVGIGPGMGVSTSITTTTIPMQEVRNKIK